MDFSYFQSRVQNILPFITFTHFKQYFSITTI